MFGFGEVGSLFSGGREVFEVGVDVVGGIVVLVFFLLMNIVEVRFVR